MRHAKEGMIEGVGCTTIFTIKVPEKLTDRLLLIGSFAMIPTIDSFTAVFLQSSGQGPSFNIFGYFPCYMCLPVHS